MTIWKSGLSLILLSHFVVPAVAADKPHLRTPPEIKATFGTGTPFTATAPSGKVIMITLKPDGVAQAVPKGKKKGKAGKWRLSDDGYCTAWEKAAENCYKIRQIGADYEVVNASNAIIAHWTK